MILIKHLRSLYDSDDFVFRFLHLLDFIEWEQGRSMSHVDYIDAFRERTTRLTASYSKDGQLDSAGLVQDLFAALFYAKLEATYPKKMGPFLAGLKPEQFTVETLAESVRAGRVSVEVAQRVAHGGFMRGPELFDSGFFRISSAEAQVMGTPGKKSRRWVSFL